jgi:murein tripeptide amidase MpaA
MYLANELITKYDTDPTVKMLVDNLEWHIFPVMNVDGFVYTHTNTRLWRKTRRPNPGSSCVGTVRREN